MIPSNQKNINNFKSSARNLNSNERQKLKFIHWNPNSIKNKLEEFSDFLAKYQPDFVSLNETKLNQTNANKYLRINGYETVHKARNDLNGAGGCALLIKNNIKYEINEEFDELNLELCSIKITINDILLTVISYYNPPDVELSIALFSLLNTKKAII